jgi:hypothetical protein
MKIPALLAILAALAVSAVAMADSRIADIRSEYQAVRDALPRLRVEQRELSGYSTEGGVAKAYRDAAGAVRLIRVELHFESGKMFEEFYFKSGMLIFAFRQEHHYNVPFNVTPEVAKEFGTESFDPRKTRISENRYYFHNRKMIRWLGEGGKEVPAGNRQFKEREKETLQFLAEVLAKFKG